MLSAFEEKSRMLIYGNRDDFKPKECSLFLESKFAYFYGKRNITFTKISVSGSYGCFLRGTRFFDKSLR